MDGKTLRGSRQSDGTGALHLVSAYATAAGLVLAQRAVDGKSNEITAIPELLDMLALEAAIISIDAMGTQKGIAARIVEKKADYVLALTPMTDENARAPENPGTDYLREAMKKSLDIASGKPAFFDFQVQLRADKYLPVEDATAEWPEAIAPFQNVATIRIERQNFDHPYQITECEHLVFTPWHGLRAHQPIGGINRLRRDVYAASSKFRARQSEPSDFPRWPW